MGAGVLLMAFLGAATGASRLVAAGAWLRLPPLFLEITLLTVRFLGVLYDEACRIWKAQKLRLGHQGWKAC